MANLCDKCGRLLYWQAVAVHRSRRPVPRWLAREALLWKIGRGVICLLSYLSGQMTINLQPTLENDAVQLVPLREEDFEALYEVASDPKIWEQHPNKDRWQRAIFESFFRGAMESRGAFIIMIKETGEIAGSTRFYDYDPAGRCILIGYTFYGTRFWGRGINPMVKRLMMDYIFQFVDKVQFHIGAINFRSQTAIQRLGAYKIGEENVAYYGEATKLNFVYEMAKVGYR